MLRDAKRSWSAYARFIVLIGLATASGCQSVKPTDALRFDPALVRSPPEVAEVSVQVLVAPNDEGNARLLVRFKDKVAREGVVIQGGAGPTRLRDDGFGADERAGDGIFSAFVHFDAPGYEAELKRRAERKLKEVPVFKNRMLIGRKRIDVQPMRFPRGDVVRLFDIDPDPSAVDAARELMITDVGVIEDPSRTFNPCNNTGTPMGAWTFGKLMTEMANQPVTGIHPSDFTLHWLQSWSTDQTINGFTVDQRLLGLTNRVLTPWPKLVDGRLDLAKAPFRLLAIVNRIDLRGSTVYGSGDAGEARLVFGLLDCNPALPQAEVQQFTVIFEYGINKSSCSAVRGWAQQWLALGTLVLASAPYNAALQAVTDQFTLRNADPSKPPNRSALNQLRTNEFALGLFPAETFWELREFKICAGGACSLGRLEQTTVAQTPDRSFLNQPPLRDFINTNQAAILAGTHEVPLQLPPSTPFRAGAIQPGAGLGWNATGIANLEARHLFSLATCNSCHTAETSTQFVHIAPRAAGSPAALSDFLTGLNQPKQDPVTKGPRTFHDLLDRAMKLDAAANMVCGPRGFLALEEIFPRFLPPAFVH